MAENSTPICPEKKEIHPWDQNVKTVVKQHTSSFGEYETICGEILVDSPAKEAPKPKSGKVFYTAYFMAKKQNRPLIFLFNGGPGSASIWLHFGAFGPQRVSNMDVTDKSPSILIENADTLFNVADLVFIDPIGTGFSTCADEEFKNFCSEKADAIYLSQFITYFLAQHKAWGRRLFICGESYGGYRAALMVQHLIKNEHVHPEGLILIAPFISGPAIEEVAPNIIGEANFLVGFILSAWYHRRSSLNKTHKNETEVYQAACKFAYEEYFAARLKKPLAFLDAELHQKISALTGISTDVLNKFTLNMSTFSENLFPGEKRFPGRIDSRYLLEHPLVMSANEYLDASTITFGQRIMPSAQSFYFNTMEWEGQKPYTLTSEDVSKHWHYEEPFYVSAFFGLQNALKLSPNLRVYAAAGYYDLAVPAATVEYDLKQIADTSDLAKRITLDIFAAGHMMYVHEESRQKLSKTVRKFILSSD